MAAEEVRLRIRHRGAMRVARAHEAEPVRVVAARVLYGEPVLVRLADVAAMQPGRPVDAAQQIFQDLVPGELVVGRQCRMRFRCALELLHLGQRLVVHPGLRPRGIDRPALAVDFQRKHHAIGEVRVVRNGEQLVPGLALAIHPGPQILRMGGVHRGKRHCRSLLRILEDHIAVQVAIVGRRSPFVRGEGGERARFVELVGNVGDPSPDRACDLGADELLDRLVLDDRSGEEEIDPLDIVLALDGQLSCDRQLAQVRLWIVGEGDRAHVFRVIRDGREIERTLDLHHVARGMPDRLAQGKLVRVFGTGQRVPEDVRIERPARMDVCFAEEHVP